jgi:hypothetical protein
MHDLKIAFSSSDFIATLKLDVAEDINNVLTGGVNGQK